MVKNVSAAAFPAVVENYISPETRTTDVQSEGVLCSSIVNNHQGFEVQPEEEV
jgi:hypothetical protein